jgi:O-antigen/teichoic acid export membrane protein
LRKGVGGTLIWTFLAQSVANLQGLVVLPVVTHWAGPVVYGAYILVNITASQFLALISTGISYRYTRNLVSASSFEERRELFEPQFSFQLAAFLIASGCVLLMGPAIQDLFAGGGEAINPWILVGVIATNLLQGEVSSYFRCTFRFLPFNLVGGGTAVVFMTSLLAFTSIHRALSLESLLLVQVASSTAVIAPLGAIMLREMGLPHLRLPITKIMQDARAGLSVTLDMIVDFLLGSGDRYLITLFLSVAEVGRYQPGYQLASVALFLPRLLVTVLSPIVSRLVDTGKRAEAERIVESSLSLFLMIGIPFVVGALMVGPRVILLLTNADVAEASRWVTPLAAAGIIFCGILWILNAVAIGINRPRLILIADVKGAILNMTINLSLLPLVQSIVVPAIATLIGYAVSAVAFMWALRSVWGLKIEWGAVLRFCAAAFVMGGALWLLGFRPAEVASVSTVRLFGGVAMAGLVYFAVLWALGGLGRREWAEIKNLLSSRAPDADGGLSDVEPSTGF